MSHTPPPPLDVAQLRRYLDGESSPDDVQAIAHWRVASPLGDRLLTTLSQYSVASEALTTDPEQFRALYNRIAPKEQNTQRQSRRYVGIVRQARSGWRAWAIFAVTACISVGVLRSHLFGTPTADPHIYTTGTGERATLTLHDGTRVILAPRTTLRLTNVDRDARALMLNGEAYFNVKHASGSPFTVRTGKISTRVLGTAFDVRRYAGDVYTHVQVNSGKVMTTLEGDGTVHPSVLIPAGYEVAATDSAIIDMTRSDPATTPAWTSGTLVFHDAPATDVITALGRWYGYRFETGDSMLAGRTLTARLDTRSSSAAFATLKLLLNVELEFNGTTITLLPKHDIDARARVRHERLEELSSLTHEVGK